MRSQQPRHFKQTERRIGGDACFLARDRAADSRFLIMRLCRRSPQAAGSSDIASLEQKEKRPMGEGGRTMLSEKAGEMKEARQPLELELELPWASDPMSWISRRGLKLRAVGGMVEGGSGKFLAAA